MVLHADIAQDGRHLLLEAKGIARLGMVLQHGDTHETVVGIPGEDFIVDGERLLAKAVLHIEVAEHDAIAQLVGMVGTHLLHELEGGVTTAHVEENGESLQDGGLVGTLHLLQPLHSAEGGLVVGNHLVDFDEKPQVLAVGMHSGHLLVEGSGTGVLADLNPALGQRAAVVGVGGFQLVRAEEHLVGLGHGGAVGLGGE